MERQFFNGLLAAIPADDGQFQFAMTFAVLQHLTNEEACAAIGEMKRVVMNGGYILLCEETHRHIDHALRPVDLYKEWLKPWMLLFTMPRVIEPVQSYHPGTYMVFGSPLSATVRGQSGGG